ncbi:MAG: flagellar biosynthetic protein FliO [Candidatus Tectomicrobia bacterium]|nr:flagellar biosynthetic protein FliO [Candidatus Tectomicrobia bacterium]
MARQVQYIPRSDSGRRVAQLLTLLTLLAWSAPAPAQPLAVLNYLQRIEVQSDASTEGIILHFKRPVSFKREWLRFTPNALEVDIPQAYIHPSRQMLSGEGSVIRQISALQLNTRDVRLRLVLAQPAETWRQTLRVDEGEQRLAILLPRVAAPPAQPQGRLAPETSSEAPVVETKTARTIKPPRLQKGSPPAPATTERERPAAAPRPPEGETAKEETIPQPANERAAQETEEQPQPRDATGGSEADGQGPTPQQLIEALLRPPEVRAAGAASDGPKAANQGKRGASRAASAAAPEEQRAALAEGKRDAAGAGASPRPSARKARQSGREKPGSAAEEQVAGGRIQPIPELRDLARQAGAAAAPRGAAAEAAAPAPPAAPVEPDGQVDAASSAVSNKPAEEAAEEPAATERREPPRQSPARKDLPGPALLETPDLLTSSVKMAAALALLLGMLLVGAHLVRRYGLKGRGLLGQGSSVKVHATHYLGAKKSLAVVEVEGQRLVLGVTPQSITLLASLPGPPGGAVGGSLTQPNGAAQRWHDESKGERPRADFGSDLAEASVGFEAQDREEESLTRLASSIQEKITTMRQR